MPVFLRAPWPGRAAWLALPFTAGPALADALDGRSGAVQSVASSMAWAVWAVGVVAVLVPRTVTLSLVRIAAPGALAATVWAVARGGGAGAGDVVALAWVAATMALAFSPATGDHFVNGSSYGPERRMPLRPPGALVVGPVELAWALLAASVVTGPLLLATEQWLAGSIAVALGVPVAAITGRALHGLARRWMVFVPAGVVLHDPLSLLDPVLLPRQLLTRIGPAPAGDEDDCVDVTAGALGLALEARLSRPAQVAPVTSGRRARGRDERTTTLVDTQRLLFTPTRPGAVLAEARARHLPVG